MERRRSHVCVDALCGELKNIYWGGASTPQFTMDRMCKFGANCNFYKKGKCWYVHTTPDQSNQDPEEAMFQTALRTAMKESMRAHTDCRFGSGCRRKTSGCQFKHTEKVTPVRPVRTVGPVRTVRPVGTVGPVGPVRTVRPVPIGLPVATKGGQDGEAQECAICFGPLNDLVAFVPCGHTVCAECGSNVDQCYTCGVQVDSLLRIYY